MKVSASYQPCEVIRHQDNIHELVFHEASAAAFEEATTQLQNVMRTQQAGEPLLIAMNISHVGSHPINNINGWLQQLIKTYGRTLFDDMRVAFIYDKGLLVSVSVWFSVFAALRSGMIMSMFTMHEYKRALEWLRSFKQKAI
jgi:hypothetical protein